MPVRTATVKLIFERFMRMNLFYTMDVHLQCPPFLFSHNLSVLLLLLPLLLLHATVILSRHAVPSPSHSTRLDARCWSSEKIIESTTCISLIASSSCNSDGKSLIIGCRRSSGGNNINALFTSCTLIR